MRHFGDAAALGGHRRDRHVGRNLVRDPKGLLDLPKGYRYHVIEKAGDAMDDGGVVAIVAGLTFFPALALGPIVEHLAR